MLIIGSNRPTSQAGWNSCNLSLSQMLDGIITDASLACLHMADAHCVAFPTRLGSACLATVLHCQQLLLICTLGSARGCPGSTCISPVWLERCNILSPRMQGVMLALLSLVPASLPGLELGSLFTLESSVDNARALSSYVRAIIYAARLTGTDVILFYSAGPRLVAELIGNVTYFLGNGSSLK